MRGPAILVTSRLSEMPKDLRGGNEPLALATRSGCWEMAADEEGSSSTAHACTSLCGQSLAKTACNVPAGMRVG